MADTVNAQTIDSVTQTAVEVVGMAPSVATANLYQAVAAALAHAANNGTQAQQAGSTIMTAVASAGSALVMAQGPK